MKIKLKIFEPNHIQYKVKYKKKTYPKQPKATRIIDIRNITHTCRNGIEVRYVRSNIFGYTKKAHKKILQKWKIEDFEIKRPYIGHRTLYLINRIKKSGIPELYTIAEELRIRLEKCSV